MIPNDNRHAPAPDHSLERLIFFSDAVFAIAITLLIIEIHVPHLPGTATIGDHLQALADLTSSFLGFFISFAVIGAFWAGHHRAFGVAAHHSDRLVGANLSLLCAIVFMPFATAYMSSNMGQLVPAALYAATLIVCGLLNFRLVAMATRAPVVDPSASRILIEQMRVRGLAVVLGAACAFVLAFVDARFSQMGLMTIPFWQWVLRKAVLHRLRREGIMI